MTGETQPARPLSPHLQIWRWHITMAASIAHRASGVALYAGLLILAAWALALAADPIHFDRLTGALHSPVGLVVLFLITLAVFFHLANGVRHLVWDLGFGFRKQTADKTALAVIAIAIAATVLFWLRLSALGALGHG